MNFDTVLKDFENEPIQVAQKVREVSLCSECTKKITSLTKAISLRDVCIEALLNGDDVS